MLTKLEEGRGAISNFSLMFPAAEKAPTLGSRRTKLHLQGGGTRRNGFRLWVEILTGYKDEVFYNNGGEALEQVCPERWWMPHPWKHPRSGWMGLRATWSRCRCPCSLQGRWTRWPLRDSSNSNEYMILFYEPPEEDKPQSCWAMDTKHLETIYYYFLSMQIFF